MTPTKVLINPSYFTPIASFSLMYFSSSITMEGFDNYRKQSFRNRCQILGANGVITLSIPVIHTQKKQQASKDTLLSQDENWQKQHLKSLISAYGKSPYFEYYIDEISVPYHKNHTHLLEFNLHCLKSISNCLDWELKYTISRKYLNDFQGIDARKMAQIKPIINFDLPSYTQVFSDRFPFIPNLSILDLIFNLGPETPSYLYLIYTKVYQKISSLPE